MHIVTLATLFPNAVQPNFGIFVGRQCAAFAKAYPEHQITVINPVGLPPWPLSALSGQYRNLRSLPLRDKWEGITIYRPRFRLIPGLSGPQNPQAIARALLPLLTTIHAQSPVDLIDAQFFYPDGPAAHVLAKELTIPFSIKARGADIHYWGQQPRCGEQIVAAGRAAHGLLAVSQAIKQDMVDLGLPEDIIKVHYTGCDQSRFAPQNNADAVKTRLGINGDFALTLGALIERKNPDLVLRAVAKIDGLHLVFAGDGAAREQLRNLAISLGCSERVHFLGNVPHDDLPDLLSASSMMILPSQSEGLANAWVEALACDTPIIISEAGGARELLSTPLAGRIVDQNVPAIAKAIAALRSAPPEAGLCRAQVANFTWENNARNLESHFRAILRAR